MRSDFFKKTQENPAVFEKHRWDNYKSCHLTLWKTQLGKDALKIFQQNNLEWTYLSRMSFFCPRGMASLTIPVALITVEFAEILNYGLRIFYFENCILIRSGYCKFLSSL